MQALESPLRPPRKPPGGRPALAHDRGDGHADGASREPSARFEVLVERKAAGGAASGGPPCDPLSAERDCATRQSPSPSRPRPRSSSSSRLLARFDPVGNRARSGPAGWRSADHSRDARQARSEGLRRARTGAALCSPVPDGAPRAPLGGCVMLEGLLRCQGCLLLDVCGHSLRLRGSNSLRRAYE
jgi:hypothetical protein